MLGVELYEDKIVFEGELICVLVFYAPVEVLVDLYIKVPDVYRLLNDPGIVKKIAEDYSVPYQTCYNEVGKRVIETKKFQDVVA